MYDDICINMLNSLKYLHGTEVVSSSPRKPCCATSHASCGVSQMSQVMATAVASLVNDGFWWAYNII